MREGAVSSMEALHDAWPCKKLRLPAAARWLWNNCVGERIGCVSTPSKS